MAPSHARRDAGFTLIEIISVIAVIALLAAILFPVFAQARAHARQVSCATNMSEIGLALQMYAEDWDGRYPAQDDNLAPIARRLKLDATFTCPSAYDRVTLSERKLLESAKDVEEIIPPRLRSRSPDSRYSSLMPVIVGGKLLGSAYYYHGGLTNDALGSDVLLAERMANHSNGANVLWASGRLTWLPQEQWVCLVPKSARHTEADFRETGEGMGGMAVPGGMGRGGPAPVQPSPAGG